MIIWPQRLQGRKERRLRRGRRRWVLIETDERRERWRGDAIKVDGRSPVGVGVIVGAEVVERMGSEFKLKPRQVDKRASKVDLAGRDEWGRR